VQNFINRWATQQLLVDGAMRNLSEEQQEAFNKLIVQYKNDLYTKAYMDALVKRSIDTTVTKSEEEKYYNLNKDVFKLNDDLVKFRYIHVDKNITNFNTIEKKFRRFNEEDRKDLNLLSIQFKSYSLNDSIWVKASQVVDKMP